MMMLRNTTGPYGQPVIEVVCGRWYFHSTEAVWEMILSFHRGCIGDDSSGRVVGVSAWCIAHVWHTRVNTSVDTEYYFLVFNIYKNLSICISCSKYICSIKEHGWSLTLSWPDEDQRMLSTAHEFYDIFMQNL